VLFGRLRILGKLGLLVLVPLLGVVALSVPIVVDRINTAERAQHSSNVVKLATQVSSAVQELQQERLLSVGYVLGLVDRPELAVQTAQAQDKLTGLAKMNVDLPLRRSLAYATTLDATRTGVLSRKIRPDLIVKNFTAAITPIINHIGLADAADLTTATGRQIFALEQALRTDDIIGQLSANLANAVALGKKQPDLIGEFSASFVEFQQVFQTAQPYFTKAQYKLYLGAQEAFTYRVGADFFTSAISNPSQAIGPLEINTLFPSLRSLTVLGGFVERRIAADVNTAALASRDSALRTAYLIGGGSLLLLIIVIGLSVFMARAVARPLRRLTFSADRIARAAETELERVADDEEESVRPIHLDPVDVAARDEIGDLARAFDRVQTTAVRLVERQVIGRRNVAQMFAHVGRRTQNLVGRQLALIDNLERRETDGDRLRELYRLDHMSSRLRRNAGSLVVLSGGAGANEHMAPLSLTDVVRLALGEIEDYTRVDVDVPEQIMVVPSLVADLTLLLAELMENATTFSPPHTRVDVTAGDLRGGARLAIVDHGLGLSPERLAEENARLTRRERLDLAPSEVLGLFVVGRLARRHGVEVTLTATPDGGVTAWVDLSPVHLIAYGEAMPLDDPYLSQPPLQATVEAVPWHASPRTPIQATVPRQGEFVPLLTGASNRSIPGSAQPFDENKLSRATRTLQTGPSWNAFIPVHSSPAELEAVPSGHPRQADAPTYYEAQPPRSRDAIGPIAGRVPMAVPEPAGSRTGGYGEPEPWVIMDRPMAMSAPPAPAVQIPQQRAERAEEEAIHQRNNEESHQRPANPGPLRRRVPGSQLPAETGTAFPTAPPSANDAVAAREAFDAFEAGVSRAQWDVAESEMASPPAAGHPPLTRRVPGATLPLSEPMNPRHPATPAAPLDPDAARAMVEQFEYGVSLALNETQPQHEGQPR
jgi:hypothetical protein